MKPNIFCSPLFFLSACESKDCFLRVVSTIRARSGRGFTASLLGSVVVTVVLRVLQRILPRRIRVFDTSIIVRGSVFNPGYFITSKLLAEHLRGKGRLAVDVGTGSGVLAIVLARRGWEVVGVDVNPEACACAWLNAVANRVDDKVSVVLGDGVSVFRSRVFDQVVSNPPYLEGRGESLFEKAIHDPGKRFLVKLLVLSRKVLRPGGSLVVAYSSLGGLGVLEKLAEKAGWRIRVLGEKVLPWEKIRVYKLTPR